MMNKRILELADQAWTMVSNEERSNCELYEADRQRERRDQVFAELIVRECMSLTSECSGKVHPDDLNELFKEHFGMIAE